MCSPDSRLPSGSDQSSHLERCTSNTSTPWTASAAGRHTTAPAAGMTSVIGRTDPPFPDQGLLHVSQRISGLVAAVTDPAPVPVEPPGGGSVVHAEVEHPTQPALVADVRDLHHKLYPAIQVPVHHVGAADPDLHVFIFARAERVDAGMLKEPAEYAADPDVVGQAGQ